MTASYMIKRSFPVNSKLIKQFFKFTLLQVAVLLLLSCSRQKNDLKKIDIFKSETSMQNISDLAEEITYTPLSSDSILSSIIKVIYSNGDYYILDNRSKFLRFDKSGRLLNQIGYRGSGPGEYYGISKFAICHDTHEIFIAVTRQNQVMVFDPNGKFKRSISTARQSLSSIGVSDKNLLVFSFDSRKHENENMELIDANGIVLKSFKNKYDFGRGPTILLSMGECLMYEFDRRLYFKEIFSDTVFYLVGEKMIPEFILGSGMRRLTPEKRTKINNLTNNSSSEIRESGITYVDQNKLFETASFLFYQYSFNGESKVLIYNKSTGQQYLNDLSNGFINDLDGGPHIIPIMTKDNNTIISWINAFKLKQYIESDAFKNAVPKYPEKKKSLEKLANSLSDNDNPVLILVRMKEK